MLIFKHPVIIILFFLIGAFQTAHAQDSLTDFVKKSAMELVEKKEVPGIMVAWSDGSNTNFYSAGYAIPAEKNAFDKYTKFEAGSITKTFTAFVLEKVLAEKGIDDNSAIGKYLPDTVAANEPVAKITFLQLTNHTSGLPRMPVVSPEDQTQPYEKVDDNMLFYQLKRIKIKSPAEHEYSNWGAALAGMLAERISGKTYEQLLEDYIFTPWNLSDSVKGSFAQGHFQAGKEQANWKFDAMAPAGALVASGREMMNYLKNMSNPIDKVHIPFVDSLLQPSFTINEKLKVARGWFIAIPEGDKQIYWHNGGTYGFSTFAAFEKGTQKAVLVVINQFNKNAASDRLGMQVMKRLLQ